MNILNLPIQVQENLLSNKKFYSMYDNNNIERCKIDSDYLGEAMLVNEDLIWHSVHKYVGKPETISKYNSIEKDDILQLGREGFIKAVYAFDTTRGIKFSSFAVTAIVREVRCFLRDKAGIMRLTRTAHSLLLDIHKIECDLGYLPSVEDIALLLNEDVEKVRKVLIIGKRVRYLDEPMINLTMFAYEGAPVKLGEVIREKHSVEDTAIDNVYVDNVIDAIRDKLSELELDIFKSQLDGHSQTYTAKTYDVSQMKVSRVIKKIAALLLDYTDLEVTDSKYDNSI